VEGAADSRFLAEAAEKVLAAAAIKAEEKIKEKSKEKAGAAGLWTFLFPTGGLSQAAVLMIAQLLNFFVATKGVLDENEGKFNWAFWEKWLSGECLIYFGEILLLIVFMLATPEFPYSVKALWKEDISAITLMVLSAMTIVVLNALWGVKMVKTAISKIKEAKTTAVAYREKAIQQWEYLKSVYTVCKERAHIMMGDDAKKKREVKEEIYAGFKQQLFETCPWLETAQRFREEHAPTCCQDPDDGGYFGDKEIALALVVTGLLVWLILKILHHHATKAIHHGIHHLAKHHAYHVTDALNSAKDEAKEKVKEHVKSKLL
jgi:hypothetical protein